MVNTEPLKYYWIAVNGSSAAANLTFSSATPKCIPTPNWFIGFTTSEGAYKAQQFLLHAPVKDIPKEVKIWQVADKAKVVIPDSPPEPPTPGPTMWISGDDQNVIAEWLRTQRTQQ
jgi:hypothetical protein